MITPAVIQSKEFTKVVRGYKEDEVDKFLNLITRDLDTLLQENRVLRENIIVLNGEIEKYRSSESNLFETLESAKALMNDISASAEKRAEGVLKNAELEAQRIQREARESVGRITEEAMQMAHRWDQFKQRYRSMLQNEMDRFENLNADLLNDTNAVASGFYTDYESPQAQKSKTDTVQPVRTNKKRPPGDVPPPPHRDNRGY